MGLEQIVVQLNPDVMPSGSDLAVVNAARRSFGKRSDWDYTYPEQEEEWDDLAPSGWEPTDRACLEWRRLKEKDKRLIEFLARGMTQDDFDVLLKNIQRLGYNAFNQQDTYYEEFDLGLLSEKLWQWRHTATHDTPFNHCHISFEVQAPIFVARQLVKTEYAPFSEFSRRYITEDVEFYRHHYRNVSDDKKQGSWGEHHSNDHWSRMAYLQNKSALDLYNSMIADGVAPEQARGQLPQDLMTSWTWSATLGAFAKMCRERLSSDAQKETQKVAQAVYGYLKDYYPVSAKALVEGV